jgi:hypothetical protein
VIALSVVELQDRGQRVEHTLGGAGQGAALHPHVVINRHSCEERYFLATQTLDPAVATIVGQVCLVGRDAGTT